MSREFIRGRLGVWFGVVALGADFFGEDRSGVDGAGGSVAADTMVIVWVAADYGER
jgi:hypothetical protein